MSSFPAPQGSGLGVGPASENWTACVVQNWCPEVVTTGLALGQVNDSAHSFTPLPPLTKASTKRLK